MGIGRGIALVSLSLIFTIGFASSQNVSAVGTLGDEHVHANLEVKIFGFTSDFSASKFQIKSSWIHFEDGNGSIVHRHASDVPLVDLFNSFNVGLTDSCYTFQNIEQYCTNDNYSLKFFVNNGQVSNLQDYVIQEGDEILITYASNYSSGTNSIDDSRYTGVLTLEECLQTSILKPTLDPIPSVVYGGDIVSFTGKMLCDNYLVSNVPIEIWESTLRGILDRPLAYGKNRFYREIFYFLASRS